MSKTSLIKVVMNISTVNRVFENETWASTAASMGSAVSKAEGIVFCVCLALILISIVLGNLLTIILFVAKKRLRKKSLFLVVNMAFADLMLGAVSLPIYIYLQGKEHHLWKAQWSTSSERFYRFFDDLFMQLSLISAAMISGERFYATYHPFKHRTLSQLAYRALICLTWILASIISAILFALFETTSYRGFLYFWLPYTVIMTCSICGWNIAIWRKVQRGYTALKQPNRVNQSKRLTKTLLLVSFIALLSWLPLIAMNAFIFVRPSLVSGRFYYLANMLNFSNSFVNPLLYALRIPDFKDALFLYCYRKNQTLNSSASELEKYKRPNIVSATESRARPAILALDNDTMETRL